MLPPVMLPVALTWPAVVKLPPVTLAVTDTVVPVWVVALTLAPPKILPPVMFPTALNAPDAVTIPVPFGANAILPLLPVIIVKAPVSTILPAIFKLPPVMLPVALTCPAVVRLPPDTLAVTLTVVPV